MSDDLSMGGTPEAPRPTMEAPEALRPIMEAPEALRPIIEAMCQTAAKLSQRIALGPLGGALGQQMGVNADGDGQKALDIIADEAFMEALRPLSVRFYASEEQEEAVILNENGRFAIAIDPLDGSSNIDVNVSIGTIFSIYEARDDARASFLRPGHEQIAAGYFIYGPQTGLVVSFGAGTSHYILSSGGFHLVEQQVKLARDSHEFAINASNYRHWPKPISTFIDDCLAGEDGPQGKNYNMRWVASLVADTHRILSRGGIFLYPGDKRVGYGNGRLRFLYECAPIAMLIEQAGGSATDGNNRLLDKTPSGLHMRTAFIFGSTANVERVVNYHDLPEQEVSALFGKRGLFRGASSQRRVEQ